MNITPVVAPAPEVPSPVTVRTVAAARPIAATAPVASVTDTHARAADPQAVKEAVAAANEAMKSIKSELDFSVDDDTGKTIVRVIDKQTGTLIRQMPSREMLEIAKALDRLQGLLVSHSA
jgi:flagellar protein FlaG